LVSLFFLQGFIMPIVTLEDAKLQLNITDDEDDLIIDPMIGAAIGMVEHALQHDIYEKTADIPVDSTNVIDFEQLKDSKKAAIEMAIKLAVSTLYLHRESSVEVNLIENPAFNACLAGFTGVYLG